jgi:hypothetical protein
VTAHGGQERHRQTLPVFCHSRRAPRYGSLQRLREGRAPSEGLSHHGGGP